MHRRDFLRLSTCSVLPFLLKGCVVSPVGVRPLNTDENGPLGGSWEENARRAQALFVAATSGRFANDRGVPYILVPVRKAWMAARGQYASIEAPSFNDNYVLSGSAVDYLRELNKIALRPRGAQRRERMVESVVEDGVITLLPGELVSFSERGFCMDPRLPAPGAGELLRLVPTSSLIPEELRPIYVTVLKQASRTDTIGTAYKNSMQAMVWLFRTAGQTANMAILQQTRTNAKYRQLVDAAYPGGWNTLVSYHQQALTTAQFKSDLTNAITRGLRLSSRQTSSADFLGQSMSDRVVDDHLLTLINSPVIGNVVPGSQYTLLASGVAAEVVGSAPLTASFRLLNLSGSPFKYSSTEWSAESQRKTQRVALAGSMERLQGAVVDPTPDSDWWPRFQDQFADDFSKFAGEKILGSTNSAVAANILRRSLAPVLKTSIDMIPLLGNAAALYEAVSGRNWMTGEPLNGVDRALAIAGTIPGASVLARLGGGATGVVRGILNAASASKSLRAVERTALARDIVGWGNSDSVRTMADHYINDPVFQQTLQAAHNLIKG